MRLRRSLREHVFGEALPCERRRLERIGLRLGQLLPLDLGWWNLPVGKRKQRGAGAAIQDVDIAELRHLRDRLDRSAVPLHRDEVGRRGKVPVPHVVPDALEMPDALAGAGVERQHAVGEQVIAVAVDAVEIERRRAGGGEHHRVLLVHRDAGPGIRAADERVGVRRPCVVREFAGQRNRVEHPAELACVDVERANVSRGTRQRLGNAAAHDQQVLEYRARRARADAAEAFAQVDAPVSAEGRDRHARLPIDGPQPVAVSDEHAVLVNRDAAMTETRTARRAAARIELPDLAAGCGIHRHHFQRRRCRVEHAVHDHRVALHLRALECIMRVVGPRDLQLPDVVPVDVRERRVADVVHTAMHRPLSIRTRRGLSRARRHQHDQRECFGFHGKPGLFGAIGAADVHVAILARAGDAHAPRIAADFAVLDEAAADVRFEIDLDLLAAVRARDEELIHVEL